MQELIVNLHIHTTYSDGSGTHEEVCAAALKTGVDVLLVTDHNILVKGVDGYYPEGKTKVLLLACEEVHDQARVPQKNHLLVLGADQELATLAADPQELISAVRAAGGLSFLAHPIDPALPAFGQTDISWENWQVRGFTGMELWNGLSELKVVARNPLEVVFYAFFPAFLAHGPVPALLRTWDDLLLKGHRVVGVGGSDAHAMKKSLGFIHRTVFPYEYHFSAVNTHILTDTGLTGNIQMDRRMVFDSLGAGHCFIGYDLPGSTRGFRFTAQGRSTTAIMGDQISCLGGVTLQVIVPAPGGEIQLIMDGKEVRSVNGEALTYNVTKPGIYRVEVYRPFLGRRRGWIFSNPIYVS